MDVVALTQSQSDRETRVNANGRAAPDVKVATAEIARDGCGLLFGQVAGTLAWTKGGSGGTGEGAVVVVVLLVGQIGLDGGREHLRCSGEGGRRRGCQGR